jgi:hypothetical protein
LFCHLRFAKLNVDTSLSIENMMARKKQDRLWTNQILTTTTVESRATKKQEGQRNKVELATNGADVIGKLHRGHLPLGVVVPEGSNRTRACTCFWYD